MHDAWHPLPLATPRDSRSGWLQSIEQLCGTKRVYVASPALIPAGGGQCTCTHIAIAIFLSRALAVRAGALLRCLVQSRPIYLIARLQPIQLITLLIARNCLERDTLSLFEGATTALGKGIPSSTSLSARFPNHSFFEFFEVR